MCGITGLFDTRATRAASGPVLQRMNDSQHHRGPDEGSVHLEPGVGLGHRRLSIIDLATGQQPLFNEDGSVCVVFNGEIYNYQELIPELQALGHIFHTKSDTECIVHAWEEWGRPAGSGKLENYSVLGYVAEQREYWDVDFKLNNPIGAQEASEELVRRLKLCGQDASGTASSWPGPRS